MIEELLRLLYENNMMLRFICEDIINRSQTQDLRDIANNVTGDLLAQVISEGTNGKQL